MMKLSNESIKFILSRVIANANDAVEESKKNIYDEYYLGRKAAYYEVLDTIKSELEVRDQELKEFGLDINLEESFL